MADYEISAEITADAKGFEKGIKSAQKSMQGFSSKLKDFTKSVGGGVLSGNLMYDAIKLITKGIKVGIDTVKKGVKEYEQFNKEQKLLAQTLEATGAKTWTTVESLNAYADALQETTNYSGGEISQLQTVLLGFKNITGENFNEATNAILDMASVMNMDLTSATQAVAKALDDPIKGINSLSRQGFIFTEQQKEQLAVMVEVGDIASAQKVILKELSTTYGGASQASAKASTQLKNNWTDVLEQVGRIVVIDFDIEPAVKKMNTMVKKWKESLQEMADAKEKTDKLIQAQEAERAGTATEEQKITVLKEEINQKEILLEQYKDQLNHIEDISAEEAQTARNAVRVLTSEISSRKTLITQYETQLQRTKDLLEEEKERLRVAKEQADLQAGKDKKATDALTVFNQTIKNAKEEIEIRRQTGEIISEEDELREMINVKEKAYIQLIKDAEGTISGNLKREKMFIEGLVADRERLLELTKEQSTMESNTADWLNRIREQEITSLERSKEAELENAKIRRASPKEIFDIVKSYQEKELDLFVEKTNREKAQAYSEAVARGAGEEEKLSIITYYNNLITDKEKEQAEERKKIIEEENKRKEKSFERSMKKIISTVSEMGRKLASAYADFFKGITSVVSNVFGKFKEIVNMNFDEITDTLLAFEDKVLTFFVITLPKLPQYLANILSSIATLVNNLADIIDAETIANIFTDMFRIAGELLPDIFENITTIVITLMDGLVTSIETFIQSGDFFRIVDTLFDSIDRIIDYVAHNILGNESIKEGIAYLVTSAFAYLPNLVTDAVDGMLNLIDALLKGLTAWIEGGGVKKLADSVLQGVVKILEYIGDNAETIANDLVDIIFDLVDSFIDNAPTLIGTLIESTLKLAGEILGKVIERLPAMIVSIIKSIPNLFVTVAEAIWNGIKNAFKSIGKGLEKAWDWIGDSLGWWATGANNVPKGLAVVGESGPELVDFHGGERVYNAKNTQGILSGASSGGNSFNVTFNNVQDTSAYAMIKELKIYQRQMAVRGGLI